MPKETAAVNCRQTEFVTAAACQIFILQIYSNQRETFGAALQDHLILTKANLPLTSVGVLLAQVWDQPLRGLRKNFIVVLYAQSLNPALGDCPLFIILQLRIKHINYFKPIEDPSHI